VGQQASSVANIIVTRPRGVRVGSGDVGLPFLIPRGACQKFDGHNILGREAVIATSADTKIVGSKGIAHIRVTAYMAQGYWEKLQM
jgi:hypothetical protein